MDIIVSKKDILRLLERCAPLADKKSPVPMLANVLLTAEDKALRVAATDLYLGMAGTCEAEVPQPGAIGLPATDLLDRVKAMPDGPVQITTGDSAQATVKAVGSARRYTLSPSARGEAGFGSTGR